MNFPALNFILISVKQCWGPCAYKKIRYASVPTLKNVHAHCTWLAVRTYTFVTTLGHSCLLLGRNSPFSYNFVTITYQNICTTCNCTDFNNCACTLHLTLRMCTIVATLGHSCLLLGRNSPSSYNFAGHCAYYYAHRN